jgi:hypothetical protein
MLLISKEGRNGEEGSIEDNVRVGVGWICGLAAQEEVGGKASMHVLFGPCSLGREMSKVLLPFSSRIVSLPPQELSTLISLVPHAE